METFSALLAICAGNSPVTGEFPAQRPVTRSFDVFFDLSLKEWLSKQSWGWWFETPSCPLWRHSNGLFKTVCYENLSNLTQRSQCCYYIVMTGLIWNHYFIAYTYCHVLHKVFYVFVVVFCFVLFVFPKIHFCHLISGIVHGFYSMNVYVGRGIPAGSRYVSTRSKSVDRLSGSEITTSVFANTAFEQMQMGLSSGR